MAILAAVFGCAVHALAAQPTALPAVEAVSEPAPTSPLLDGGLATGAAGAALLAVGLVGFGCQVLLVQPSMQRYVVLVRHDGDRTTAVVTDVAAYQRWRGVDQTLFGLAAAVSSVGATLLALGGLQAGSGLLLDGAARAPAD